jgi:DNA polymerase-3 subunit beta
MKCIIDAKELRATLKAVKPWVPIKPFLQIMSHVLVTSDHLGTHITAYDYEAFGNTVRFPLEAFTSVAGSCAVKFKDLIDMTTKAEGKVVLDFNNISQLRITFANTTLTLKAHPKEEFPDVQSGWRDFCKGDPNEESASTSFQKFIQAVEHTYVATDNSSGPNHFTRGIMIDVNDKVNLIATDGRRLHTASIEPLLMAGKWQALISAEIAMKIARLKVNPLNMISFGIRRMDDLVFFSWTVDNIEGFCTPMDTPYPEWDKVVPTDHAGLIEVSADALSMCIDRVSPIAKSDDGRDMVVLNGNNTMKVSAHAESMGSGESTIACNHVSGPEMLVALNYVYLLDVLKLHKGKRIHIIFQGDLDPVMIRSSSDSMRSSILMPVRLPE